MQDEYKNNNQNQSIQPNYDFINNQQVEPPKKKSKVLYIFAGVIGLFLLIMVLIAVSAQNNVKQASGPKFDSAAQVPEQYLRYISDSQYSEAYQLFSQESRNLNSEDDFKKFIPLIMASVDTSQCRTDNVVQEGSKIIYFCKNKNDQKDMKITFEVVKEEDTYRIKRYDFDLGKLKDAKES